MSAKGWTLSQHLEGWNVEPSKIEKKLFDSKKKKNWRARTSARAPLEYSATYAKKPWFLSFHSDMRFGARPNFFYNCNFYHKISLQFFLFDHNSKSKFFRAIWSLINFFENSIFFENCENFKILKIFKKKIKIFMKKHKFQRHLQQSI